MAHSEVRALAPVSYAALAMSASSANVGLRVPEAFDAIERYLGTKNVQPNGPAIVRFRSVHGENPFEVEVGWSVEQGQWIEAPYVADILPAAEYLVASFSGALPPLVDLIGETKMTGLKLGLEFDMTTGSVKDTWGSAYIVCHGEPVPTVLSAAGRVDVCLKLA